MEKEVEEKNAYIQKKRKEKAEWGENSKNLSPGKHKEAVKKINKDSMDEGSWNKDMPKQENMAVLLPMKLK